MSFKPIDSTREEFRKYLDRTGVLDVLSKVLVKLYETSEKPENAIEFVMANLGSTKELVERNKELTQKLQQANDEIEYLKKIINTSEIDIKNIKVEESNKELSVNNSNNDNNSENNNVDKITTKEITSENNKSEETNENNEENNIEHEEKNSITKPTQEDEKSTNDSEVDKPTNDSEPPNKKDETLTEN